MRIVENRKGWFQFSLRWLMIQTGLAAITLALCLTFFHSVPDPPAWQLSVKFITILASTGAIVGGCFGNFKTGAAIGFVHGLLILATIVFVLIPAGRG